VNNDVTLVRPLRTVPLLVLGMSLSLFFFVSYLLCVLGYLFLPGLPVDHAALSIFLPGFTLLSWTSFGLGLVESFVWGWYVAIMFGLLYNFISARR
jgi:hypothetical protein